MSIAEDVVKTPSFSWKPGALAVPANGYRIRVRVTDANVDQPMVQVGTIPVLKDWGTIGTLIGLINEHPRVFRITKMGVGQSADPKKRAHVEVSLHDATGFHAEGKKLGDVLSRVLIHLDQAG